MIQGKEKGRNPNSVIFFFFVSTSNSNHSPSCSTQIRLSDFQVFNFLYFKENLCSWLGGDLGGGSVRLDKDKDLPVRERKFGRWRQEWIGTQALVIKIRH